MKIRLLGGALLISAVIASLNGFRPRGSGLDLDALTHAVYFLWGVGGICGVLGLLWTNAFGSNAVARTLGLVPLVGFASIVLAEGLYLLGVATGTEPWYNTLGGVAWGGILAGMLVAGIVTIAAKTWTGWRRFVPLATVVFPVSALAIAIIARIPGDADWPAYVTFIVLGAVIASTKAGVVLTPATAR